MGLPVRNEGARIILMLVLLNAVLWFTTIVAFHGHASLLAMAALAYVFGIRHGFDIDHLAAIDNVTRKLVQEERPASSVGLHFSLGHSSIVFVLTVIVALSTREAQHEFEQLNIIGKYLGTLVSSAFLMAIAISNLVPLFNDRLGRSGACGVEGTPLVAPWIVRPPHFISRSWHMYFVGLLFGLGFDTATEVGVLGISASGNTERVSVWLILLFPALFASAMSLMDSLDSILMREVYGWALRDGAGRRWYNVTITAFSTLVAVVISVSGIVALWGGGMSDWQAVFAAARAIRQHFSALGTAMVAVLLLGWLGMTLLYRVRTRALQR